MEIDNINIINHTENTPKKKHSSKKLFKRIVLIFTAIIVFLFIAATLIAYIFEDKIADVVLKELYKSIKTEVNQQDVSFSLIRKFPMASLEIKQMHVQGLSEKRDVLSAEYVFLQFNIFEVLTSNFKLKRIEINNAVLRLKVFKDGVANWEVFNEKDTSDTDFALNLNVILFRKINVSYEDLSNDIEFGLSVKDLNAKGDFAKQTFDLQLSTNFMLDSLLVDTSFTLKNKKIQAVTEISIDTEHQKYHLKQGEISMDKLFFIADVNLNKKNEAWHYVVKMNANEIVLKDLLVHLPLSIKESLQMYDVDGLLNIQINAKGQTGRKKDLDIASNFKLKKGKVINKENNIGLTNLQFTGTFKSSSLNVLKTSVLELVNIDAMLNREKIAGAILVKDLTAPFVSLSLKSDVNLADWQGFMPENYIYKMEGDANIDAQFQNQFQKISSLTASDFKTATINGNVVFSDVLMQLVQGETVFKNVNGKIAFSNQLLFLDDLSGSINDNNFLLNGKVENFFDYLLDSGSTMTIVANVSSPYLNFNTFLTQSENSEQKKNEDAFELVLPKHIDFNFVLNVNKFVFDNFEAKNINCEVVLKNHTISVNDLVLKLLGGTVYASGYVQEQKDNTFIMYCNAKLNNTDVQSMFHSFNNFGQSENGITDKNIRGTAFSTILFRAKATKNLDILPATVDVLASISIEDGQLINFRPLESLSKFVELEDLRNIRFATLTNKIQIRNEVITIPEMDIKNNAMNLVLSGNQNFEGDINYFIKLKLNELLTKKRQNKLKREEDFGEVVSDGTGNTYIHILATGNLDDPNFKLSNRKVNAGAKEQIKEQKQEFKTIFKSENDNTKTEKQKDKELNDYKKKPSEIEVDEDW
ncbi:MAG: AsmA-like C-terminal region-containing protein [Bacteroidales bacterium]|jgi:hypothetical protein|nr:AsmA-like C-terminal region-containing protein [Bacteroidales bacterium]